MVLYVLICGEVLEVQDPKAFVRAVVEAGNAVQFILEVDISLWILEALHALEKIGAVKRTRGVPTQKLIEGTERILTMLREELREAEK